MSRSTRHCMTSLRSRPGGDPVPPRPPCPSHSPTARSITACLRLSTLRNTAYFFATTFYSIAMRGEVRIFASRKSCPLAPRSLARLLRINIAQRLRRPGGAADSALRWPRSLTFGLEFSTTGLRHSLRPQQFQRCCSRTKPSVHSALSAFCCSALTPLKRREAPGGAGHSSPT